MLWARSWSRGAKDLTRLEEWRPGDIQKEKLLAEGMTCRRATYHLAPEGDCGLAGDWDVGAMVADETEGRQNLGTKAISTTASDEDTPSLQVDNYHMEKGNRICPYRRKPGLPS
jgi:hypothetical protein